MLSEFQLPNGVTWFTFALLLMFIAFFRFNRVWSLRNWDIVLVFLISPGLILVNWAERLLAKQVGPTEIAELNQARFLGYTWLFVTTLLLVVRCFVDMSLSRRPRLEPNVNVAGLTMLGSCLLGFLMAAALIKDPDPSIRAAVSATAKAPQKSTTQPNPSVLGSPNNPLAKPLAKSNPATPIPAWLVRTAFLIVSGHFSQDQTLPPSELELDVARSLAIVAHVLTVIGLVLIGWQHFDGPITGISMATLYLLIPSTAVHVEKVDHILPTMCMIWAIYCHRRPLLSGALFGFATWFIFPIFVFPAWLMYYGRQWWRFLASFAVSSLVVSALILLVMPTRTVSELWTSGSAWRPWELAGDDLAHGIWTVSNQAYRLPIFAIFCILIVMSIFLPKRKTLGDLLAMSALFPLLAQFWYADRGGCYTGWYLPVLLCMIFRPTLLEDKPGSASTLIS